MPEASASPPTDEKAAATDKHVAAADEDVTVTVTDEGAADEAAATPTGETDAAATDAATAAADEDDVDEDEADDEVPPRAGLTPRQARRVRSILSSVVMVAVAAALVLRLGSAPSVLTVGFYGIALILSGAAIGLSRRGRTRVATGVLGLGFGAVVLAEQLLATAQ